MTTPESDHTMGRDESYGYPADILVEDQDGNAMRMGLLDGTPVPAFGRKFYKQIPDLEIRNDDVFICGYPKTGCHWTWEVVNMILSTNNAYSKHGKMDSFLERVPSETLDALISPRVLNTHVWYNYLPKQMREKKTKIILTTRNPKDTAVSYYNHVLALEHIYHYKGTFNVWLPLYLQGKVIYGSFSSYHLSWDKAIKDNPEHPIFVANYENMKEDLPREIRAMARFLNVDIGEDRVEEIVKATTFQKLQTLYSEGVSRKFFRKGEVGDWKNWVTVASSEQFDEDIDRQLAHTRFRFRYTL